MYPPSFKKPKHIFLLFIMTTLPTRTLAGVQVPDTPLITKALDLCRKHLNDLAYNHSVRSWLFGFIIAAKIPERQDRDLEAHAIAAILHDLGWAEDIDLVSDDKRFEVDGAIAAREFLEREAGDWDKHRLQLVWDAIALHTTPSIAVRCFHTPSFLVSYYNWSHMTPFQDGQTRTTVFATLA